MKVSYHSGRNGNPSHNDRTFDLDKAPHIDQTRTHLNKYQCIYKGTSFVEAERKFYKTAFKDWLKDRNERAKKQRHDDRKKTAIQLMKEKRTTPEETIFQIGNMDDFPDDNGKTLTECYNEWMRRSKAKVGKHRHTLDMALHVDEATPHIHERHLWLYVDHDKGYLKIGQEEALKRAGYEPPFPDKPLGINNNRKMVYDAEMRELWYTVCEEHGITVDRRQNTKRKHLDKADYIAFAISEEEKEREQNESLDDKKQP